MHKVLSSYDVLGGTGNLNVLYTTQKFHDENPRTYKAFYRALSEAASIINRDKMPLPKLTFALRNRGCLYRWYKNC